MGGPISGGGGGFSNPMTTAGDLIVGGAAGTPERLPLGAEGESPRVVGGALVYAAGVPDPTGAPDGQVPTTTGGVYGLAAPPTRSPVAPACVSRWLLDDSTPTIVDSVGSDDLSYNGAAGQRGRPSPWGKCLYTGGLAAGAGPKGAATVEPAAVSVLAWANAFVYADGLIVAKRQDDATWSGSSPTNAGIAIYVLSNGLPGAYALCASGSPNTSPAGLEKRLPLDVWCRVVATYDETDGLRFYVNGQLAGSAAAAGAIVWGSGSWTIGVNNSGSGVAFAQTFNGFIRDVCVCDRVLTPAEILRDYQQGIGYAP